MTSSIRWRIVLGTVLLTLMTVCAVGVVALLLMQLYMVQQERAYLAANAEAIAQQAAPFMTPIQMAPPLQQLAQTAAFLGDINVRIVDNARVPLADSAVMSPYTATIGVEASPLYFTVAAPASAQAWALTEPMPVPPLPADNYTFQTSPAVSVPAPIKTHDTKVIVVQRTPSIWGDRLIFDGNMNGVMAGEAVPGAAVMGDVNVTGGVAQWDTTAVVAPLDGGADVVAQLEPTTSGRAAEVEAMQVIWEKQVVTYAGVAAIPTFLQSAGLQAADMVTAPIQMGGMVAGFVELGRSADLVDEPLAALRRALAIAAGASALLAIGVGLVMSRSLTMPIQKLANVAVAMSSGDLTARAPVSGRDELGALARQFNQMADALHRTIDELAAERDTLRRFVADASHELRTPITALRTFNELLQGAARHDPRAAAEFLQESDAQIARLEWVTRNLLDLSRWDSGMASLTLVEAEVGEVVSGAATPFRAVALERNIDLRLVLPETPVVAKVDEQRLGMAVGNLLDNALKFTPCGGRVEVGVKQAGGKVSIWVLDTGMGIDKEEFPHIFERFYRSPRARQNGSGLGLAIVERIVKAHGAIIEVESTVAVGSRFMLCFANSQPNLAQTPYNLEGVKAMADCRA